MKRIGDMLKQVQGVQRQMAEIQEKLEHERFEASAPGGLVQAVVDGKQTLKELKISPDALRDRDVTQLEKMVIAAVTKAQRAAGDRMKETVKKLTGGMNLPLPF